MIPFVLAQLEHPTGSLDVRLGAALQTEAALIHDLKPIRGVKVRRRLTLA